MYSNVDCVFMHSLIGLFQIEQNGVVHECIANKLYMKDQSLLDYYSTIVMYLKKDLKKRKRKESL